jgi:Arylsulfotransferase (ASST).
VIVSSRENFVIAIDYETGAIKWILGDPTKKVVPISFVEAIRAQGRSR